MIADSKSEAVFCMQRAIDCVETISIMVRHEEAFGTPSGFGGDHSRDLCNVPDADSVQDRRGDPRIGGR